MLCYSILKIIYQHSWCLCFTWFLNYSIAGISYLLPFGLIWVLVVVEVAINSRRVTLIKFISSHKDDVNKTGVTAVCDVCGTTKPILRLYKSHRLSARLFSWTDCNVSSTPCGNKGQVMKQPPPVITTHLSITAKHSFLQVKRLPRRSRKVPGAVVMGGGVCLHSISSIGNGAGRMFRVAPGGGRITGRLQMKAQPSHCLQVHFWIGSINCTSKKI